MYIPAVLEDNTIRPNSTMMADPQQAMQRLKDLVVATQKGLEVAEGYGEQATALVNKCKVTCEKLELAYTKLDLISNEISKQLHVCTTLAVYPFILVVPNIHSTWNAHLSFHNNILEKYINSFGF